MTTTTATTTTMTTGSRARTSSRTLSARLDREWAQLSSRSSVVERVRSWALTDAPFRSLDEFLGLTGFHQPATSAADELLGRVVALAADEPLAARIVLQRILPGLLSIVRAEQYRDPEVNAFDLLVGEAWCAIVAYRVAERSTHVAARLLHDARHRAFTAPRRRRRCREVSSDLDQLVDTIADERRSSFEELSLAIGDARRAGLADSVLDIVRDLLRHGSTAEVAAARAITSRAVRYRQRDAVDRIRRILAA